MEAEKVIDPLKIDLRDVGPKWRGVMTGAYGEGSLPQVKPGDVLECLKAIKPKTDDNFVPTQVMMLVPRSPDSPNSDRKPVVFLADNVARWHPPVESGWTAVINRSYWEGTHPTVTEGSRLKCVHAIEPADKTNFIPDRFKLFVPDDPEQLTNPPRGHCEVISLPDHYVNDEFHQLQVWLPDSSEAEPDNPQGHFEVFHRSNIKRWIPPQAELETQQE